MNRGKSMLSKDDQKTIKAESKNFFKKQKNV